MGRFFKARARYLILIICVLLVSGFGVWAYTRPLPAIVPVLVLKTPAKSAATMPWPAYGQSAVGVGGAGVLSETSAQTKVPIASIAKVMTALAVLKQKPLQLNQPGPILTLAAADVALYQKYLGSDGSVVRVESGEQLSEYQALQALLLPSANNLADSLAIWAFGSLNAYQAYATQLATSLGLSNTVITDASGFAPNTVSTAHDLVLLGEAALQQPVIAQIVAQSQADLPLVGTVQNVNIFAGQGNVIGIKTGNTDQAGGCYLFAGNYSANGQNFTAVGAILGAKDLGTALVDGRNLLGLPNITTPIHRGDIVAEYSPAWSAQTVKAVAAQDMSLLTWPGTAPILKPSASILHGSAAKDSLAGQLTVQQGTATQHQSITLSQPIPKPSTWWRLVHFMR